MKLFSLPLNPKLSEKEFYLFIDFLHKYREYIFDIYFTSRIPPFTQDAMGDIFITQADCMYLIETALYIQQETGISVSATFNNIQIPPHQELLDVFIEQFKPLYDAGIHSATIPHSHWVATGQLQKAFPKLFIKNTILREVKSSMEIVNLAKYGFNYINLDRDLMRDSDALREIFEAKKYCTENGMPIKISLLANEGCLGNCPMMVEHFEYNNTRRNHDPQYFNSIISRNSCSKWDKLNPEIKLRTANLPPWKEDWDRMRNEFGIDVFKMHGRENIGRLFESIDIIKRYVAGEEILFDGFNEYVEENNLQDSIQVWRKRIQNCKFNCWKCDGCRNMIGTTKEYSIINKVMDAIDESAFSEYDNTIEGLTSKRVKSLLHALGKESKNYLEIGAHNGSTVSSVVDGNSINAHVVDLWEDDVQPANVELEIGKNSFDTFLSNMETIDHKSSTITVHRSDLFDVDLTNITNIDLFFYDGPHDYKSTYRAIHKYKEKFSEECVMIFDDANWEGVVASVDAAVVDFKMNVIFKRLILNEQESPHQWWNGLYILIVKK